MTAPARWQTRQQQRSPRTGFGVLLGIIFAVWVIAIFLAVAGVGAL